MTRWCSIQSKAKNYQEPETGSAASANFSETEMMWKNKIPRRRRNTKTKISIKQVRRYLTNNSERVGTHHQRN